VVYQVDALPFTGSRVAAGEPSVEPSALDWFWRRHGLVMDGVRYANGISVHAPSSVTLDLGRACVSYDAVVGVDRMSLDTGGKVRFFVYADGSLRYASGAVSEGDRPTPVHVGLAGRESVRLVVRPVGDGSFLAVADWADARVSCS
jgi:hypothetical protein